MGAFDVVVLGFKLNGPDSPARVLERVLGESAERAKTLSKRFPSVVRSGLSRGDAELLATALREGGARVEVRAPSVEPSATPAGDVSFKLGTLRIELPVAAPERASPVVAAQSSAPLTKAAPEPPALAVSAPESGSPASSPPSGRPSASQFVLGTLRIILQGGPPRPPAAVAPPPAAPVPPAVSAPSAGPNMLDDVFESPGESVRLSFDAEALASRAQYVSGGRKDASLAHRMRESLMDIPLKVVRRARAAEPAPTGLGRVRSIPLLFLSLLATGIVAFVSGGYWIATRGKVLGEAAAAHAASLEGEQGESERSTGMAEDTAAVELHPMLKLAPEGMKSSLASILRSKVPGVRTVAIDWKDAEAPAADLQCVLVGGNASQRGQRVQALLATGKRFAPTPMMEEQLNEHAETMRVAEGDPNARYTSLCLTN